MRGCIEVSDNDGAPLAWSRNWTAFVVKDSAGQKVGES
jgi:hypothetical protein